MTFKAVIAALALLPGFTGAPSHALLTWHFTAQRVDAPSTVGFESHREFVCRTAACTRNPDKRGADAARASMPEPETLVLFGLGLLLFGLRRRRQARSTRSTLEDRLRKRGAR